MLLYRLLDLDGEDVGEIDLGDPVGAGDVVFAGLGQKLRVVAVVPATGAESRFDAMLMVEPACAAIGGAGEAQVSPSYAPCTSRRRPAGLTQFSR